jgi:hypothetical protein
MLHILRTPTTKKPFAPRDIETRWCFKCRKHLKHEWFIHIPYGETGQYYEPHVAIECEVCKTDSTEFGSA